MHELSIAISIVQSVSAILEEDGVAEVAGVRIAVGTHAGVVVEALAYAWGPATGGTPLAGSMLNVETVPATTWCPVCEVRQELPGLSLKCPSCGTATADLLTGRELDLLSFEIRETMALRQGPHATPRLL